MKKILYLSFALTLLLSPAFGHSDHSHDHPHEHEHDHEHDHIHTDENKAEVK